MRRILVGLVALGFAAAALATPVWTAPGWYQVDQTVYGDVLDKGPFADEDSCKQQLPPSDDESDYDCEYFDKRPDWDE